MPTFVFIKRTFKKHPRFCKIFLTTHFPFFSLFSVFSFRWSDFRIYSTYAYRHVCAYSLYFFSEKSPGVYRGGYTLLSLSVLSAIFIFPYKFLGTFLPAYNLCLTLRVNIN